MSRPAPSDPVLKAALGYILADAPISNAPLAELLRPGATAAWGSKIVQRLVRCGLVAVRGRGHSREIAMTRAGLDYLAGAIPLPPLSSPMRGDQRCYIKPHRESKEPLPKRKCIGRGCTDRQLDGGKAQRFRPTHKGEWVCQKCRQAEPWKSGGGMVA